MAAADKTERPIIIIKRTKKGGAGHHGGAWKVAYADFVTAMMAFFLVLWLVASVSKEQRAAIFEYFKNPSMQPGKAPTPAPGQMGPGGASTSPINLHGGMESPRAALGLQPGIGAPVAPPGPPTAAGADKHKVETDVDEARRIAEADEKKKLESLMDDLKKAIAQSQALQPFKDQLLLDITPEGLRIQIVDEQNRAMFDSGSSRLKDYTDRILRELATYLNSVPNRISLTGHTDVKPYIGRSDYSNWELSADRANAARRALLKGGLRDDKVARVVGLSSAVLFDKVHPDDPINRRISIVVMTRRAEEAALKTDQPPARLPRPTAGADTSPATGAAATVAAAVAPAAATPVPAAVPAAPAAPAATAVPPPSAAVARPSVPAATVSTAAVVSTTTAPASAAATPVPAAVPAAPAAPAPAPTAAAPAAGPIIPGARPPPPRVINLPGMPPLPANVATYRAH